MRADIPAHDQKQGSVLRSSADENGYLLSRRNGLAASFAVVGAAPRSDHKARCKDRLVRGKRPTETTKQVRRRSRPCRAQGAKQTLGRKPEGDKKGGIMTTVVYVSMRCMDAPKVASLNIGSCSAVVRHTRLSARPMSLVASSLRGARAYSAQASRGQVLAPPFLT